MKRIAAALLLLCLNACTHAAVSTAPATLRIYLARHGQTDWNAIKRLQGQADIELNETGRKQAAELAARMSAVPLDHIYSSALRRSHDTALIAAGKRPVEALASLNEQAIGKYEGLYVDGRDPEGEAEFKSRVAKDDDSLDGGESNQQFFTRICGAVEKIHAEHPSGTILIVGHGGTNSMILRCLLHLTRAETESIHQANDELYLIELSASEPRLWKAIPKDKLGEL